MTRTVQIAPEAALAEASQLNEHYRNRNLILANALHEAMAERHALLAEIERLKPPEEPTDAEPASKKPASKSQATVQ